MLKKILAILISIALVVNVVFMALQIINFWTFLGVIVLAYLYLKFLQSKLN